MNKWKSNNIDSVQYFHHFLEEMLEEYPFHQHESDQQAYPMHEKDEELPEFHLESYPLDCILLIQFALEDRQMSIKQLSAFADIKEDLIQQLFNQSLMPWELPDHSFIKLIQYLELDIQEVIEGLRLLQIPSAPILWNQIKDIKIQFKRNTEMCFKEPLSDYARNYREQHETRRDLLIQELQLLR